MNDQTNRPNGIDDPDLPSPQGALPVWSRVYSKPSEKTFQEIINHPEATAKNAYIWMFIAGTLSGLISSLTQFVLGIVGLQQTLPGFDQLPGATGILGATGLIGAICGAPITGLFTVLGFAFGVAVIHWAARFFGSKEGTFDQLAYAIGAVAAPISIVSALLIPFNAIRYAVFCIVPLLLAASIYVLYLELTAVKAVYRTGWLEAAGVFFLPTILIVFLCACVFLGLIRLAGPAITDALQQVQPGF